MAVPTFTIACTRKTWIARDVCELAFTKPQGFSFKAGQFVLLEIPLVEDAADLQPRAFSLSSAPGESELLFAMKMKAGGRASRWIQETVTEGTTVTMKGPFGMFCLKPEQDGDWLFIGTSTGAAPFRSMLVDRLRAGEQRRIDFLFGVRAEEDLFWADELGKMAQVHKNFFLHIALSQPSAAWTGHKGRVQGIVPLLMPDIASKRLYICGSPEMTKDLKRLCLEEWGVSKEMLHVEGYI